MKIAASIIAVLLIIAGFLYFHHQHPPSITGIGVAVTVMDHSLKIMEVMPDTPAARAGVFRGLIIQRIGEVSTDGRPLAECVAMMRGPVGSKIQLELVDPTQHTTNRVEFKREAIALPVENGNKWLPSGITNASQILK